MRKVSEILHLLKDNKYLFYLLCKQNLEIDETIPPKCLVYQGSSMQQRDADFLPNNMSCFICQKLFSSIEFFEEHIQTHGDDTDFEYLSQLHKLFVFFSSYISWPYY